METFDPFSSDSISQAIIYVVGKAETEDYCTEELEFINAYVLSLKVLHDIIKAHCPSGQVTLEDKITILTKFQSTGMDIEYLIKIPV
jgi:hypothetical protein